MLSGRGRKPRSSRKRRDGDARERRRGFVLRIVEGPNVGKEYVFDKRASIGRIDENDIVLVEHGISRQHARVFESHGIYMLEDLGSANGTRLNGEKIAAAEVLREGDHITLSLSTFRFSALDALRGEATKEVRLSETELRELDVSRSHEIGGASRRPGIVIVVGVVALLVAAAIGYWLFRPGGGGGKGDDLSDVPIVYTEEGFFKKVIGFGNYDDSHPRRAVIHFEYIGGRVTVQYGAWGVDRVGELTIALNGDKVGEVPLTMQRWVYGLEQVLPTQELKKKGMNVLVFDSTRNPPNRDPWEICYVQILQEAIPAPNPREARRQFELARKAWEDREIEPSNMCNALRGFKKARDLLEAVSPRPPLYGDAIDLATKIHAELTRRFQEALFSAQRALRVDQDARGAREILANAMRYFCKGGFRYREIERYLDGL